MSRGLIFFGLQVFSAVRTFTVAVCSRLRLLKHSTSGGEWWWTNLNSNPGVFKDYVGLSKYEKQLDYKL